MKPEYVLPAEGLKAFNCVRCHVFAKQHWFYLAGAESIRGSGVVMPGSDEFRVSRCEHCRALTIWRDEEIIYPLFGAAEPPSPDMPAEVKADYEEAASIASQSPRGAAALLRLAIQKLCKAIGKPGKDLDDDIAALVKDGLPVRVQRALDVVRVVGNNAVHPGQINLNDNRELTNSLFKLVNFITERMISEPRQIEDVYKGLPQGALDHIQDRDGP